MDTLDNIILVLALSSIIMGFMSARFAGLSGFMIIVLIMSLPVYPLILWYEHNQAEIARQKYGHYVYMGGDLTDIYVFGGLIIVWSMTLLGGLISLLLGWCLSQRISN